MRLKFTEIDKDVIITEIESYINQCPSLVERLEYRTELKSVKDNFSALYNSGVFHDAIGKVVDVYTVKNDILAVEVETEY